MMSIEVAQIFLLDDNLHILFGQERVNLKSVRLADIRQLISEALHNKSYSHLVSLSDNIALLILLYIRFRLKMGLQLLSRILSLSQKFFSF